MALTSGFFLFECCCSHKCRCHKSVLAPAAGQTNSSYWNSGDGSKLRSLFEDRKASTKIRNKKEIKPIREEQSPHTKHKNFSVNFLKKVTQWEAGQMKKGSNRSNKQKRDKY